MMPVIQNSTSLKSGDELKLYMEAKPKEKTQRRPIHQKQRPSRLLLHKKKKQLQHNSELIRLANWALLGLKELVRGVFCTKLLAEAPPYGTHKTSKF